MSFIFLILALGCLGGVFKAISDMKEKKKAQAELKEKLGVEYDAFLEMRSKKK